MTATRGYPFPSRAPMRISFTLALTMLGLFGLVPAIAVVAISFTNIQGLPGIPVNFVGFDNFVAFFSRAHLDDNLNALGNTLVFAISSTVLQMLLALGLALVLNRAMPGRNFLRSIVFLPVVLGVTVIGLIWSLLLNPGGGPGASLLALFGGHSAFFGDPKIALALVTAVQIWSTLGVAVVIFLAGLQAIPQELIEAAQVDGASAWQRLRMVLIPLLAPSITSNVLLGIVTALQSYQLTYVLTGPNNTATQVLALEIYVQGFGGVPGTTVSQSQGYAAAISVVQFLLVAAISTAALIILRRREARL